MAGDEEAFEEFANDYLPQVYRFAARRLDYDGDLARDIVQTTLCKAIPKLGSYRGDAALMTWLCACCRNEIAAHFRRAGRRPLEIGLIVEDLEADAVAYPVLTDGPEVALLRGEQADLVHEALDALPPNYGKALSWKYLEELSVKQIAARLEVGPKAAESLLTRARTAFRDAYERLARSAPQTPSPIPATNRKMVLEQ